MKLRLAKDEEFEAVRSFYWNLIDAMGDRENVIGWKKGIYPSDDYLLDSIRKGELYVIDRQDGYAASVIVNHSCNEGYIGCPWKVTCTDAEVTVPHALAVNPEIQGQGVGDIVVKDIIDLASGNNQKCIRLDILKGNTAAERLYTKNGFKYIQTKRMYYADTGWTDFVMYELSL